jgi:hypothetical protein
MDKTDKKIDEFLSYVFKQDETSVVLKSHLYLEQTIDKLIVHLATNPDLILKASFKNKVDFLYSIGSITKDFYTRLLVINSIRNKFSHEYQYKLSKKDIEVLSTLTGKKIKIPEELVKFPRTEKSVLFATVVALLNDILDLLARIKNKQSRKILIEIIEKIYKETG